MEKSMTKKTSLKGLSRREFLTRVGKAGGAAAVYESMVALGLMAMPTAWAGIPKLKSQEGTGKSVLILGAGIGGLTTAYILNQYGYRCRILEASHRAGGRNYTARRGDTVIEESQEHGRTTQRCQFDSGLYLNLGPGRLPYHHRRVLGYCQELGVALEPYIMNTTGNMFQSDKGFDGKPEIFRQIQTDTRGYIGELLSKAINKGALDDDLSAKDKNLLLGLLQKFSNLGAKQGSEASMYTGSTRAGCGPDPEGNPTPNTNYSCEVHKKGDLSALLQSEFWEQSFYDPFEYEWQSTMFQPVGGMDKIVEGFLRKVGHLITYNAPVVDIKNSDDGVSVSWMDGDKFITESADYCASNIPAPILNRIIKNNNSFDKDFRKAVAGSGFSAACKVGWQCNTRFWEKQPVDIYGGISWTDDIIEQIWYPSYDYFSQKGTLTGAYIHDNPGAKNATLFGNYSLQERLQKAREGGAKIHDEFNDESIVPTKTGLSIAWKYIVHQEGAWPHWGDHQEHDATYRALLLGDRRFYVVGDQTSTLPGWQEGAMMSAEHVIDLISGKKSREDIPQDIKAPDSLKITQGVG